MMLATDGSKTDADAVTVATVNRGQREP